MKQDDFDIVRATLEHLDVATKLFGAYRIFYEQTSDLPGARAFLQERMERDESVLFIAMDGDTGLGFTQLYPLFSSVSMGSLWLLNDLYVAPEARKRGVGAALLERAREFARETGAVGLELSTAKDNFSAQRLYEKLGWKRDEDYYHYALDL
ncbi:MAG: GNAT family N-acetyltransferase [Actinomycetota bacterium]|nr:GNAT family N-acetyltransferase [Actinomycetota bacterium]